MISVGLVGARYHEYDRDYVFATVETLNRDEHLQKYDPAELIVLFWMRPAIVQQIHIRRL